MSNHNTSEYLKEFKSFWKTDDEIIIEIDLSNPTEKVKIWNTKNKEKIMMINPKSQCSVTVIVSSGRTLLTSVCTQIIDIVISKCV